jgi:uncharacterized protein YjbI with pentapeptide repeats
MHFNNIAFPVNLGNWSFTNSGATINASYNTWDSGQNAPYAGGWGFVVWNAQYGYQASVGTPDFVVWWVGRRSFALQATDTGLYCAVSEREYAPVLGVTDGSYNNQQTNTSIKPNGTFTLVNVGSNSNVAIQYPSGGHYMNVQFSNWVDWGFWAIAPNSSSIGPNETLSIGGSLFSILLITESGVGLNLTGQDFAQGGFIESIAGVHFCGAVLDNANLSTLPNLSLSECDFTNAQMNATIVHGVQNINQAIWSGANLSGTDLSQIDPGGTQGVDFSNAILIDAVLSNGQALGSNYNYSQAQFVQAHLENANLTNLNLAGAKFNGATLTGAHLDGANLTGADLTGANLAGATLAGTILTGATLTSTIFNNVDLSTTVFDPIPKFGTSAATRTLFQGATVPAPSLGHNWSYIDLTGATVTNIATADLKGLVAVNTLFPLSIQFGRVNFNPRDPSSQQANFTSAQLFYADFTGADLGFANLKGALLKGAKLNGANLSGATLKDAWLIAQGSGDDPNQYEAAVVTNAFLLNTVLDQAQAAGVDFSGSLFATDPMISPTQASAQGAFMVRSIFSDATVVQVNFRGTQFSGAQFTNTILIGSTFPSCALNPTSDAVHSVPTMHNANISGTLFADVSGGVTTNPANMDGLEMDGATYLTPSPYQPTTYKDYYGNTVTIYVNFGPTVLGTTTSSTTCPNGQSGPCSL